MVTAQRDIIINNLPPRKGADCRRDIGLAHPSFCTAWISPSPPQACGGEGWGEEAILKTSLPAPSLHNLALTAWQDSPTPLHISRFRGPGTKPLVPSVDLRE